VKIDRIQHIEIVAEIGSGGTAKILKGVDLHTGNLVAVKVLWSNLFKHEEMKSRFIFEANQYLYLNHPGIVQLKDFIITDAAYYLVMEFIDGQNLDEFINYVSGPIPETKAIELFIDILGAVKYAHENNVLHLDIKPANIMINKQGDIKLLDFGISAESNKVGKGAIVGSPLYMSPEQTFGKNINQQSDIYSLGITLFQMLTGTTPITGKMNKNEVFEAIRQGNLPRAKDFYPFVSDDIQAIIDQATHVDLSQRYYDVDAFMDDLLAL
jgi:serine/threonine protein kinase